MNSRDAMPRGGHVTIRTANRALEADDAAASDIPPGPYVMLEVEDDGEGMSQEVAEHAFEPFFTTKSQGKGTGLGLATVYGIVNRHGGRLQLESAPGAGTRAVVWLPGAS
jgi:signal transduction histidine kinase